MRSVQRGAFRRLVTAAKIALLFSLASACGLSAAGRDRCNADNDCNAPRVCRQGACHWPSDLLPDGTAGASGDAAGDRGAGPVILAVAPPNGATGLRDDVKIVVTFSEPMTRERAQAAYAPEQAGDQEPTFGWNDAGTELTIDPHLRYPHGSDPRTFASAPFRFTISTMASNSDGVPLAAPVTSELTLLREITQTVGVVAGLYGHNGPADYARGTFVECGDTSGNAEERGYYTFDLAPLPSGIVEIERAAIKTGIEIIYGTPFGLFGDLLIQHVTFAKVDATAFNSPALASLGTLVPAIPEPLTGDPLIKDVTDAVANDFAMRVARGDRSQFRLIFAGVPNGNGKTDVARLWNGAARATLDVTYLVE